jgi:aminoglycoside phosphotransferase (APT) family kinase protein
MGERDDESVRQGLERWLGCHRPDLERVAVAPLARAPVGFSSETLFASISFFRDGHPCEEELVARLPPAGDGIFPTYDLVKQARLQQTLNATEIPVAPPLGVETDPSWIGCPFMVMPRVSGRVLSNNPSYLEGGWLHHRTPLEQGRLHGDFLGVLAGIHKLDWTSLGLEFLVPEETPGLVRELEHWGEYLEWASDGTPPAELAEAFAWCREHQPDPEPDLGLVWGDPGFSNVIFGNGLAPAAILDWELATIGPAEMDLAWFIAFHDDAVQRSGSDMPGFPDRARTIAHYEQQLGRPVADFRWFEVFAILRGAACLVRMQKLFVARGVASEEEVAQHPGFGAKLRALMSSPGDLR